jgi:hypothetical protein
MSYWTVTYWGPTNPNGLDLDVNHYNSAGQLLQSQNFNLSANSVDSAASEQHEVEVIQDEVYSFVVEHVWGNSLEMK